MRICEAMVPKSQVPRMDADTGAPVLDPETQHVVMDVVPEHPCEAPATMLARSMKEVECSEGDRHWRRTEDHPWCANHYQAGTMTHLDGSASQHPVMSPDEYQG